MALTKNEIHEQLVLQTMIEKCAKIISKYNLTIISDNLVKLIFIGYNSLLLQYELNYEEILKVISYYIKNDDLIFASNVDLIPLTFKEKTLSLYYEEHKDFLNGNLDLFFDFIFNLQSEIPSNHKIDILVTLSREFRSFFKKSGFIINQHLILTESGKKRINSNTWKALHDEQFDLVFDVLTENNNTTFYDVHELFYYALEELDKIPKNNTFNIFFEE